LSHGELRLLGVPHLTLNGQPLRLRTRKSLALLAYLALEPGPHSRDELAELLWPERPETARKALRLELHHLRRALPARAGLQAFPDDLELIPTDALWVDVLELQHLATDHTEAPGVAALALWRGEFLHGFTVNTASPFEDWARRWHLRCSEAYDAVLTRITHAQLQAGHLWDALATSRQRLRHDPLNEDAYRLLANVQHAAGLHAEAHETGRQWSEVRQRELRGVRLAVLPHSVPDQLWRPTTLPPRNEVPLIGRAALIEQLDQAWDSGKVLFLAGEGGAGKSRLAEAFMRHRGLDSFTVPAWLADSGVPFSVQARNVRTCLIHLGSPDLPEPLRRHLSQIVPELWPEVPLPLTSLTGRLQFYEAFLQFLRVVHLIRPTMCLLSENLHHWDRESHALGAYAATHGPARGIYQRSLLTYRPDALPAHMLDQIRPVVEAGRALIVEVPPFDSDQVHELLAHLEPGASSDVAAWLHRFTGGNPLFVLETARLLQERGGLIHPDYRELPRSPQIHAVITQRLTCLSPGARDVSWVAALAGTEFSFAVASKVLACDELRLAAAFEELDTAGLFRGGQFAHELLAMTAQELIPDAARSVLHRRLLESLSTTLADGTRTATSTLARHAIGAGWWSEAHRLLLEAGLEAEHLLAREEAQAFRNQAQWVLANHP
jgi:DNA-binding SARP family transcriptional activator